MLFQLIVHSTELRETQELWCRYILPEDQDEETVDSPKPIQPVYFHKRKVNPVWYEDPWGYFSFDRNPRPSLDDPPMQLTNIVEFHTGDETKDMEEEEVLDPYFRCHKSMVPGLQGYTA